MLNIRDLTIIPYVVENVKVCVRRTMSHKYYKQTCGRGREGRHGKEGEEGSGGWGGRQAGKGGESGEGGEGEGKLNQSGLCQAVWSDSGQNYFRAGHQFELY